MHLQVFEEFLNSIENLESKPEESKLEDITIKKENDKNEETVEEKDEKNKEEEKDSYNILKGLDGLTLMIRSNRKHDLMLNITGKNLKEEFLNKVKEFFESGKGSDCNVKSLICKVITK